MRRCPTPFDSPNFAGPGSVLEAMELEALIETICERYLNELLEAQRTQRRRAGRGDEAPREAMPLREFVASEERRMAAGDRSMVEADARKLLAESGHELPEHEFDQLCREIQATLIRGFRIGHCF